MACGEGQQKRRISVRRDHEKRERRSMRIEKEKKKGPKTEKLESLRERRLVSWL